MAHFLRGARYFLDPMIAGVDAREYPGDAAMQGAYFQLIRGGLSVER